MNKDNPVPSIDIEELSEQFINLKDETSKEDVYPIILEFVNFCLKQNV